MMKRGGVSSDSSFEGADLYRMLTVFIQNHLTGFSIDSPTERPVGRKKILCRDIFKQPILLSQINMYG